MLPSWLLDWSCDIEWEAYYSIPQPLCRNWSSWGDHSTFQSHSGRLVPAQNFKFLNQDHVFQGFWEVITVTNRNTSSKGEHPTDTVSIRLTSVQSRATAFVIFGGHLLFGPELEAWLGSPTLEAKSRSTHKQDWYRLIIKHPEGTQGNTNPVNCGVSLVREPKSRACFENSVNGETLPWLSYAFLLEFLDLDRAQQRILLTFANLRKTLPDSRAFPKVCPRPELQSKALDRRGFCSYMHTNSGT